LDGCRAVTFLPQIISEWLQLARRAKHLYEQHKREKADCCLPALGTPLDAEPRVDHAGPRRQFKLLEEL
jgi:hypothetical protein